MCYDDQARPPQPPGASGSTCSEDLVLTAADGNRFAAFLARPEKPSKTAVLIYPDVRGLHQFYKELALRFAETGVTALAFDYFGRTAGLTSRAESFEFRPHVLQTQIDTLFLDAQSALTELRKYSNRIFVVGFCFGGSLALLSGTNPDFGFAGVIPFYGSLSRAFGDRGTTLDNVVKSRYPVLGLYGGADPGIPESDIHQLDEWLDQAGIEHQIVIYPGAPHSFFDRRATEYADASADAWRRILDFIAAQPIPS